MIVQDPEFKSSQEIINRLYKGEVIIFPANDLLLKIVEEINFELKAILGASPRTAQFEISDDDFFKRIGILRKLFYTDAKYLKYVGEILQNFQWSTNQTVFDPMRLRTVQHNGHLNEAAKAIYHTHRDTWYSNPQCQITWWIPLHDVHLNETFEFYPQYFNKGVKNDSELFDHDSWTEAGQKKKIGWQDKKTGREAIYPSLTEKINREGFGVECPKGSLLLFAGQHLHATLKQSTEKTRFSIDFRTVFLEHFDKGIGPENVDNASSGSSISHHLAIK
jgi:hypothetical protein